MSTELQKKELHERMGKILSCDVVNRHSYFQLKYFVVGKEPTTQAKLWRCIRELSARSESIKAIEQEIEETKDNIELAEIGIQRFENLTEQNQLANTEIEDWEKALNKKELDINVRKRERKLQSLRESLVSLEVKRKESEEEAIFFMGAFESLAKVEPLKPFDDLESQTQYWNEKFAQLANLKVLLRQNLDTDLVQSIMSLSDDCHIKTEVSHMLEKERLSIENREIEKND